MDTSETAPAVTPDDRSTEESERSREFTKAMDWPRAMIESVALACAHTDMDPPNSTCDWLLNARAIRAAIPDGAPSLQRGYALAWLRRHADGIRTVRDLMGGTLPVTVDYTPTSAGVRANLLTADGDHLLSLRAGVSYFGDPDLKALLEGLAEEVADPAPVPADASGAF